VRSTIKEVTKIFRPDQDQMKLVTATRFGAKPNHKNTFDSFQQTVASPGYITEAERCGMRGEKTMNTKTDFQRDERDKLRSVHTAKLAAKQKHVEES